MSAGDGVRPASRPRRRELDALDVGGQLVGSAAASVDIDDQQVRDELRRPREDRAVPSTTTLSPSNTRSSCPPTMLT